MSSMQVADVREQVADRRAALAAGPELPRRGERLAVVVELGRLRLHLEGLAVLPVQARLGVEGVHLRGPALHEEEDDAPGLRRVVRRAVAAEPAGEATGRRHRRPGRTGGRPGPPRRTRRRSGGASRGGSSGAGRIVRSGACPVPYSGRDQASGGPRDQFRKMNSLTLIRTWAKSAQTRSSSPRRPGGMPSSSPWLVEEAQGRLQLGLRRRPGVGVQVHPPDPAARVEPLDRQHRAAQQPRLLGDERVVHQDQRLGGHVRHVAAPDRGQRLGHVEGDQHRRQEVPPDVEVKAAAAVAVERAAGLGAAVVVGVVVHERREIDLDAGAAPSGLRAGRRRPGSRRGWPRPPAGGRASGAAAGCRGRRPPPRARTCWPCGTCC